MMVLSMMTTMLSRHPIKVLTSNWQDRNLFHVSYSEAGVDVDEVARVSDTKMTNAGDDDNYDDDKDD